MRYNPKAIKTVLATAIVLVWMIGATIHGLKQKWDSTPPAADSTPQTNGNYSDDPISDSTGLSEFPVPPIQPNDSVTPAGPEQADVEFSIGDHRPDMNPSAGTGEVEYDTKEVKRNASKDTYDVMDGNNRQYCHDDNGLQTRYGRKTAGPRCHSCGA